MKIHLWILHALLVIILLCAGMPMSPVYSMSVMKPIAQDQEDVQPTGPVFTRQLQVENVDIAGVADPTQITIAADIDQMHLAPDISENLLSKLALDYTSYVYSHSDVLLFAYEANTSFEVYRTNGALVWQGILNAGQHRSLTPGAGVYLVAGSNPFAINVGDALSGYVWGYYAVDQFGRGVSTLLHTYQANWSGTTFDPRFIVFAYQDNTEVQIIDSDSKQLIWDGTLQAGQHYSNSTIDGQFITVSSTQPVAALSYTDQGFYVPSSNATFVGKTFHTYVGNSATPNNYWVEDLNLIAYENTGITVKNSDTGAFIWSGTLNAGSVQSIPNLNGTFVTIQSSGNIAVSVSPYGSYQGGNYYHSLHLQDSSGTGIGTHFVVPVIPSSSRVACRVVLFSYTASNDVNIRNQEGATIWADRLNQADFKTLSPDFGTYIIDSTDALSAILDCGDQAGATFAPVRYAVVQVQVLSPLGGNYHYGDTVTVAAKALIRNAPFLSATVTGRIGLTSQANYLEFIMVDDGTNGDLTANDGIYTANLLLPGPSDIPTGNYTVLISAQKEEAGKVTAGSGSSILSITSSSQGALEITPSLTCPTSPQVIAEDVCTLSATVAYKDGSVHGDGSVVVTFIQPGNRQTTLPLTYTGNNLWRRTIAFDSGGRYLLDIRATPPHSSPYIAGYASLVADVLASVAPLSITVDGLPANFRPNQIISIVAKVTADGKSASGATVTAQVNPGQTTVDLVSLGDGVYSGLYFANTTGDYTIELRASSPLYKPGMATSTFAVSGTPSGLSDALQVLARSTEGNLKLITKDVEHISLDGDWFRQQIGEDQFRLVFNLIVNGISVGLSSGKFVKEWEKAATKSTAPVVSRWAGINTFSWLRDQADQSIDGRAWRSWATRLETSVQSGLFSEYVKQGRLPPNIGFRVLGRAAVYYTSQIAAESMDEAAQRIVEDFLANQMRGNTTFLHDVMYPIFARSANQDITLVNEYINGVLLVLPPMSSSQESSLVRDLASRRLANNYYVHDINQKHFNLWNAQDAREAQENAPWYEGWSLTLWKIATPIVVGVVWGGPVGAGVGVIISVESLVEDYVRDSGNLSMDEKMYQLAYGSMFTSLETKETLVGNTLSGVAQVRRNVTPQVPTGRIVTINDISRGDILPWPSERQALSALTIQNTGEVTADFNIRTYYSRLSNWQTQYDEFWIDYMRNPATGEKIGWVQLAPGESKTVEVVFKHTDENLDMRPNNNGSISFVLSAGTPDGIYFAHTAEHLFTPSQQIMNGEIVSAAESSVILPHPIGTKAEKDANDSDYTIRIFVENPLPHPISAKVVQTIPNTVKIISPNGGSLGNDMIQWHRVIPAHERYEFSVVVQPKEFKAQDIQIRPTQLSFFTPQINADVLFTSTAVTLSFQSPSVFGDCNNDQTVGAADLTALALEFFDGDDNNNPNDTPNGSYPGTPACDANEDGRIGASDLTCIALIFFNGPGACQAGQGATVQTEPALIIPANIPAQPGGQVTVPIVLQGNGGEVSSLLFSIDFDETWLTFDPADHDQDGIPDAITFNLPEHFVRSVSFDSSDSDGELDIMIASFASPALALPDGPLLSVTFDVGAPTGIREAVVVFAQEPAPSFGDTSGRAQAGVTSSGSVLISESSESAPLSTLYLPFVSHER